MNKKLLAFLALTAFGFFAIAEESAAQQLSPSFGSQSVRGHGHHQTHPPYQTHPPRPGGHPTWQPPKGLPTPPTWETPTWRPPTWPGTPPQITPPCYSNPYNNPWDQSRWRLPNNQEPGYPTWGSTGRNSYQPGYVGGNPMIGAPLINK